MIISWTYRNLFLVIFVAVTCTVPDLPASPAAIETDTITTNLAILPFENLTENSEVRSAVMRLVYEEIWSSNIVHVSHPLIAETLREYRIRNTGRLNRKQITDIVNDTDADLILLGSIDFFEQNHPPEVGFSTRLLDAKTGEIVQIESRYSSGNDYVTILGLGRIDDVEELAKLELHKIVQALNEVAKHYLSTARQEVTPHIDQTTVILIPFLNLTNTGTVNQVVTNLVLDGLFHEGYRVIEPGMVDHQLRSRFVLPYGEIDNDNLKALADDFDAEYCVTGSISHYAMTTSQSGLTVPDAEIFVRVLDASSGKLLWAGQLHRSGDDYSTVLGLGTILSPGRLLRHVVRDLLRTIPNNIMQNSKPQTVLGAE